MADAPSMNPAMAEDHRRTRAELARWETLLSEVPSEQRARLQAAMEDRWSSEPLKHAVRATLAEWDAGVR